MESEHTISNAHTSERELDFSMYDFLPQAVAVLHIADAVKHLDTLTLHDYQTREGSIHQFLLKTKLIYTNGAFQDIFAYRGETDKDELRDSFRLNFHSQIMSWAESMKKGNDSFSTLVYVMNRWLDINLRISPLPPLLGFYAILTVNDVTAIHNTEDKLSISEHKLSSFIKNFPGLLYMKDKNSRFLMVSDSFSSIYPNPVSAMIGKRPDEVWDETIARPFLARDLETSGLPEGEHLAFTEIIPDNGVDRCYSTYQFPIYAGEEVYIGGACFEVTEEHEAKKLLQLTNDELSARTNELQKQQRQLSRLNAALQESQNELNMIIANKQKLFSVISHDLRSPFQGLLGFTELLEQDFDTLQSDRRKTYLGYIKEIALNLHQLIDNLVYWSRSTNATIDAHSEELSLYSELAHMLAVYQGSFNSKKITISNNILPLQKVLADKSMIKSILGNLISNALRNSKQNGTIQFKGVSDSDYFTLTVETDGCTVTPEQYEVLFNAIDHRHAEITAKELGTGIGLIIVKDLIEKMGGTLDIECTAGKSTRVSVTFQV